MNVLSSTDISREVLALIEGARHILLLVSPYFDPWERLTTEIKRAAIRPGMQVVLLLRGGDDRAKQEAKARELAAVGVKVRFLTRLHAKVYISESQAIVTSMNLLKSSALDSWELAIRAYAKEDPQLFKDIVEHTKGLITRARDESEVSAKTEALRANPMATSRFEATAGPKQQPAVRPRRAASSHGHCIRCGKGVPFKLDRPLCPECHRAWARYENVDYPEARCHGCGEQRSTSFARPLCRPCWDAQP
jgi:phosphatidylserine/phosphatidylglycerophosphate/cardiolipin synthase-like enzyme